MVDDKTRVLLILPRDLLDRARVLAGTLTTRFKLPVSLQIVLRALIEEGLKRADDRRLLVNVERQAQAVRLVRSSVRRGGGETSPSRDGRAADTRRLGPHGRRARRVRRG